MEDEQKKEEDLQSPHLVKQVAVILFVLFLGADDLGLSTL